jgi:arylsulfatase A-like enzyme
MTSLYPTATGV